MDYKGPKGTGTDRIATYSELGGGSSAAYTPHTISSDFTVPTGNSMQVPTEYTVSGTAALILAGTSIFKIT